MSKICLVLTGSTIDENFEIIKRNSHLIDIVELRVDLLGKDQYRKISTFPSRADVPVILTCRKEVDGGSWKSDENIRIKNLMGWLEGNFAYIDLEMDLDAPDLEAMAQTMGTATIRSFHDFHGVSESLYEKMMSYSSEKVIVKGAVYPQSSEDLYTLTKIALKLKTDCANPYILLGMGDFGFPTRILAEKLGSYLTFCSDSTVSSGAPGHCSAADLNNIYNFRKISDSTVINSIIGNPVSQSKSPHIHNRGYKKKKINAVYVPFLTDSPRWFMEIADLLQINGSSVTVPFKSEIISLVDNPDKAVNQIGASNTIYRNKQGKWQATNTDAFGLVKALLDFLKIETLDGKKIAVIGAGGAARAAVFALQNEGADVALFNRTLSKAVALAKQFSCLAFSLGPESNDTLREYSSVIVQTSSAGMPPLEDVNPLSFFDFDGSEVVYDIIYKPEVTKLMAKASEAGCAVLGGYPMLEEQAALQFRLFTGSDYK